MSVQCVQSCDVAARKQPTKNLGRVERAFGFGRCVFFLHSVCGVLKFKFCLLLHWVTHCKFLGLHTASCRIIWTVWNSDAGG